MSTNIFTTQDADRLLGLADQFLQDWEQNEGKDDPECKERRREWEVIRPLLVAAPKLLAAAQKAIHNAAISAGKPGKAWDGDFVISELNAAVIEAVGGAA
jgi:hypothetical protein